MSPRVHRRARIALLALLLSGVAVWLIPSYFNAERYHRRLQAGLEQTLHRRVTFGRVSVRVLPRPGFVIENAAIQEDPTFGSEPFVRVDRVECDIRWQSLWGRRLAFSHFRLQHPNINLVRRAGEGWNVERLLLLLTSAPSRTPGVGSSSSRLATQPPELEVEDGRVNFKLGDAKKPLAITDLRAQLSFDPAHRYMRFRLVGYPVRTDLSLPTPGAVEASGEWTVGRDLQGPLNAVVRAREALVYDWAPLLSGHNTGLYGVVDAELRLVGSLRSLNVEGQGRLSDLHRWDQIPPSDPMPWTIAFRGQLDRERGRVLLESATASFAASHFHVSGTVDYLPSSRGLDLVLGLERSRLEDLAALVGRLGTFKGGYGIRGRVDAMLTIQGPWTKLRYGGFVGARDVELSARSVTFPVSEVAIRVDNRGARLAPVSITLAPRVALEVEGSLDRTSKPFRYDLTLASKAVPLREVLNLGRALRIAALQGWNAQGSGTVSFHLTGSLPSHARPVLMGRAELRTARLVIPGLTEPINIPRAGLQVNGDEIVVDPLSADVGACVFTGRLEHRGQRLAPWTFDLHGDTLDLERGASWFVAFAHRNPIPLLRRLPGLSSLAEEREVASNLFSSINVRGRLAASKVSLRKIRLDNFRTNVEIIDRVVRLSDASFHVGGGQGHLKGQVDLTAKSPRLAAEASLSGVSVQSLATHLPPALRSAHGSMSIIGRLETTGLSEEELGENLEGHATVSARELSLGGFDPLGAFVRLAGEGGLEPPRGPVWLHSTKVNFQVHDRRVALNKVTLEFSGARLTVSGSQGFDGAVNLHVAADLQRLARRRVTRADEGEIQTSPLELDFAGPLDKLAPVSHAEVSRARE